VKKADEHKDTVKPEEVKKAEEKKKKPTVYDKPSVPTMMKISQEIAREVMINQKKRETRTPRTITPTYITPPVSKFVLGKGRNAQANK
jgi:hypothetical protein